MTDHPFFHSSTWFSVLEGGFGARTFKTSFDLSLSFTVFRVGPFSLAYINFPIGLTDVRESYELGKNDILQILREKNIHILNFSTPYINTPFNRYRIRSLPETSIENLENWEESRLAADVRYELRRSQREGLRVREVDDRDYKHLHKIYKSTVTRHKGQVRYTSDYFSALVRISKENNNLDCKIGFFSDEDRPCAFIIVAHDGDTAYYLHGGYEEQYAHLRPGYKLISLAIAHARDSGCKKFNFMASPEDQPSLVKFKEKWGGNTYRLVSYRKPINLTGITLVKILNLQHQLKKLWLHR